MFCLSEIITSRIKDSVAFMRSGPTIKYIRGLVIGRLLVDKVSSSFRIACRYTSRA
jgi:hypothetical protein